MTHVPGFVTVLPLVPLLFVHITGTIVAIVLLFRHEKRRGPAMLALVGFTLLILADLASVAQGALISLLARDIAMGIGLASASVGCCFSVFEVAAVLCLIVAIWRAVSGAGALGAGSQTTAPTTRGG